MRMTTDEMEEGRAAEGAGLTVTRSVLWVPAGNRRDLPDDDVTVLLALEDGEVELGFLDEGGWRDGSARRIVRRVTHWAEVPEVP